MLMLNGFTCEGYQYLRYANSERYSVNVRISKINSIDDIDELFNQQMTLKFNGERKFFKNRLDQAHVKLEPAILIRPKCKYAIEIQFETKPGIRNHCLLNSFVIVDHNIVIKFDDKRGAISSLDISRLQEENYFGKVFQNPLVYLIIPIILLFFYVSFGAQKSLFSISFLLYLGYQLWFLIKKN